MNQVSIIKKAILSEKTHKQMEVGIYTFLVPRHAKKNQITGAIERQFSVKVTKINIANKPAKKKRIARTRKQTEIAGARKATIWLAKGQSIASLLPKTQKETKAKSAKGEKKGLIGKIKSTRKKKEQK